MANMTLLKLMESLATAHTWSQAQCHPACVSHTNALPWTRQLWHMPLLPGTAACEITALYIRQSLKAVSAFGAADYLLYMAADALTEVASQMKALELRVTALSSARHSSPTSAEAPATARSVGSGHHQADSASSMSFNKVVGGPSIPIAQAEQRPSSSAALSGLSSQAEHGKEANALAPKAVAGSAITDRAAAGRAVPSTGLQGSTTGSVSLVPDLMSFSPAVSTRPTGLNQQPSGMLLHPLRSPQHSQQAAPSLNAASGVLNSAHVVALKPQPPSQQANSSHALVSGQQHHSQPSGHAAQVIPTQHAPSPQQPKQVTGTQGSDRSQLAGAGEKASSVPQSPSLLDSRTGSPLPGGSFYDNAVFGSPTPTPSPQRDALGSEPSLLSPGSSPRPQQQRGQLHPSTFGSKPAGESACCCCFPCLF